jgi:DNA topoisomerase-1
LEDVDGFLREVTGEDFAAKDFRTWAGTVLAARALQEFEAFDSQAQAKRNVVRAVETVARRSATPGPSAASATSTRPSLTPTWTGRSWTRSAGASPRKWRSR